MKNTQKIPRQSCGGKIWEILNIQSFSKLIYFCIYLMMTTNIFAKYEIMWLKIIQFNLIIRCDCLV